MPLDIFMHVSSNKATLGDWRNIYHLTYKYASEIQPEIRIFLAPLASEPPKIVWLISRPQPETGPFPDRIPHCSYSPFPWSQFGDLPQWLLFFGTVIVVNPIQHLAFAEHRDWPWEAGAHLYFSYKIYTSAFKSTPFYLHLNLDKNRTATFLQEAR
jgi:hypothetical protein